MSEKWHTLSAEETLERLKSNRDGLSDSEAQKRLKEHGPNELEHKKKASPVITFLKQFLSPLIYVLIIGAIISAVASQYIEAGVILVIVVFNATIGFIQESKAEKVMESLLEIVAPKAEVKRDGETKYISAKEIIPGDIVLLTAGDSIPADARILESANLKINEAALTGESMAVEKRRMALEEDIPVADMENMVFMGTSVTSGRGTSIIVRTGMETEIGKIAAGLQQVKEERTPIQKGISSLSKYIIIIVTVTVAILIGVSIIQGLGLLEIFLLAVAAGVSAIPEGLPAVVTIVLALGMRAMANRNAIIRRLVAVETLGSATVICSDKTGTLTMNQMTVRQIFLNGEKIEVGGEGYRPEGKFSRDSQTVGTEDNENFKLLLRAASLCNDSRLRKEDNTWRIDGDPTEGALVVASAKAGIRKEDLEERFPRIGEIPFESELQYMATLHSVDGSKVAYVKGSTEKLLSMSQSIVSDNKTVSLKDDDRNSIRKANRDMAEQALRVLAVAYAEFPESKDSLEEKDIIGKLVFLGLFGMADPPREEARKAIEDCKQAGIIVKMITGDNKVTAQSIARQLGLTEGKAVTGQELQRMDDNELKREVEGISVFARIEPMHKLRIVNTLKERGHVVAVTGDGVNDAPALKSANIGVAMGITGTDVAKEASDMVLADDNFASVVAAVEEGRSTFTRLRNVVFFLLSTNLGELLALIISVGLVGVAPLLAVQIIWVNLVTDAAASIPLGMEPKQGDELKNPPRHPKVGLVFPGLILRITFFALMMGFGLYFIFNWAYPRMSIEEARTLAFTAMVSFEWFRAFNARSDEKTAFKLGFFTNKWLLMGIGIAILLHVAVIYVPFLQIAFTTVPLAPWQWGIAIGAGAAMFVIEELRKVLFPRLFSFGKWQPRAGNHFSRKTAK